MPAPRIDPDARQRQLFAIVKRAVEARSRREPGVILLEDLHWFDRGSEAFLDVMVETATTTRSLLVVNFRPEYHAGWMQKAYYQQIPLQPLTAESVAEMLRDLLGRDPSLAGLAEMIRQRTGGTPFFIEEMVQILAEDGSLVGTRGGYRLTRPVANLALPATVQAVLAARIDRLREREKEVLQTAAVIGKEVPEGILRQVSPISGDDLAAALRTLIVADFLYETALYPEVEYTFKHPLTQEVAYHTQLSNRRARLHGSVARALRTLHSDKLDEGCHHRPLTLSRPVDEDYVRPGFGTVSIPRDIQPAPHDAHSPVKHFVICYRRGRRGGHDRWQDQARKHVESVGFHTRTAVERSSIPRCFVVRHERDLFKTSYVRLAVRKAALSIRIHRDVRLESIGPRVRHRCSFRSAVETLAGSRLRPRDRWMAAILVGFVDGSLTLSSRSTVAAHNRDSCGAVSPAQVEARLHEVEIAVLWPVLHVGIPVVQLQP